MRWNCWNCLEKQSRAIAIGITCTCYMEIANAQNDNGNAGLQQANTILRGYFDTATNIMYAVDALAAIVGAIWVLIKMMQHDQRTEKFAITWLSACIFAALVTTLIKAFFGL